MRLIPQIAVMSVLAFSFAGTHALAQGPAGSGAVMAAGGGSSTHSYNPVKWISKKDARSASADAPIANPELDHRLEWKLRSEQVLSPTAKLGEVCVHFLERVDCLAALHVSHNIGIDFECLKSNVTGIRVGTDTSSCRMPAGD